MKKIFRTILAPFNRLISQIVNASGLPEFGALILLIFLPTIVYWALWSDNPIDRMIFTGDLLIDAYPTRVQVHRMLTSGEVPLWNMYRMSGMPLIAEAGSAVYYLPNLVLDLFYWNQELPYEALERLVVFHFSIAGVLMFGFLRNLRLPVHASLVGAIAFQFNGFFVGHFDQYGMFAVVVWVPGILWMLDRAWHYAEGHQQTLYMIFAGFFISQLVMGGNPQLIFYCGLFVLAYFLFRWIFVLQLWRFLMDLDFGTLWEHPVFRIPILSVIAVMFAAGLSAIATLPMIERIKLTVSAGDGGYAVSAQSPLMPRNLITLLMPEFLDWSGNEFRIYAGILTLVLVLVAWYVPNEKIPERNFFTGVILFSVILAMGSFTVVHGWLYQFVPGFSVLNVTSRIFYFANIGFAVMAAYGAQVVFHTLQDDEKARLMFMVHSSRGVFAVLGLIAVLLYLALIWVYPESGETFGFQEAILNSEAMSSDRYAFLTQFSNQFIIFIFFLSASVAILYLRASENVQPNMIVAGVIMLMLLDMTTFVNRFGMSQVPDLASVNFEDYDVPLAEWEVRERDQLVNFISQLPKPMRVENRDGIFPDHFGQDWGVLISTGEQSRELVTRDSLINSWPLISDPTQRDLLNVHYILTSANNPNPPEDGARLILSNSQGKIWQRGVTPQYANFSVRVRPTVYGSPINSYLNIAPENPYGQPTISKTGSRLAVKLEQDWSELTGNYLYSIGETGLTSPVDISVVSSGIGGYGGVLVDGVPVTKQEKGLVLAVVDPETGRVIQTDHFDTFRFERETERFLKTVESIEEGAIVSIASFDDGLSLLDETSAIAVAAIGGREDLDGLAGFNYGIIGVRGAEPGTAMEILQTDPIQLDIGIAASRSNDVNTLGFSSRVVRYDHDQITLLVDNTTRGLLTVSESIYPGWRVYVNGIEEELLVSNGNFRAVILPPAEAGVSNEVSFVFDPFTVRYGMGISLLTVFIIFGLAGVSIFLVIGETAMGAFKGLLRRLKEALDQPKPELGQESGD